VAAVFHRAVKLFGVLAVLHTVAKFYYVLITQKRSEEYAKNV
jgi:hypothetical protein